MGNMMSGPSRRSVSKADYPPRLFDSLDTENEGRLSLKELMAATSLDIFMPHSLPALYFVDDEKDGRMSREEFSELLRLCVIEKEKAKDDVCFDRTFREVITRASAAGVKDCSVPCRTSFRRFYSYSNVLSVYDKNAAMDSVPDKMSDCDEAVSEVIRSESGDISLTYVDLVEKPHFSPDRGAQCGKTAVTALSSLEASVTSSPAIVDVMVAEESAARKETVCISEGKQFNDKFRNDFVVISGVEVNGVVDRKRESHGDDGENFASHSRAHADTCSGIDSDYCSSSDSETDSESSCATNSPVGDGLFLSNENGDRVPSRSVRFEPLDANCATAIDAAVVESVSRIHIHKLVDALQCEGAREEFMKWLWNLVDFNCTGIVTLEELRVFLAALREDGIDLEELAFYKESGVPLDECIINEFDTTHSGGLEQDEFMVFADLVTREYEYWESRHLDCVGDYELGRTIGRGSSGVVRLGVHVDTHEKVAVKIIRKGRCADMSSVDREIEALKTGAHAHIVDLKQVLESEENMFLVLGLCGGGSLANVVRLYPEQRMPERTARFYVRQILEALAFCHERGICHRDVRLDNILLDNSGMVKVTDFGHSKTFSAGWDLHSSTLVGSIYNLSPEQVAGQLYSGEKIDVWSTGVAVYCLLVGRPPFHDIDSVKLLDNISSGTFVTPDFLSDEASDLVRCMIRASPDERLPLAQVLQHPWFYVDNDECPEMDVYKIAVDSFFMRRPDLAELIMAGTIHEHNLHFHLADKLNPTSSPEDLRGQDWSLKCLCPQMDIKFSVSFFSKPPSEKESGSAMSSRRMPNVASFSALEDACSSGPAVSCVDLYSMFDNDSGSESADDAFQFLKSIPKCRGAVAPEVKKSTSLDGAGRGEWTRPDTLPNILGEYTAPIDAFPHRRVLPRKAVPEATRLFDSDSRIAAAAASAVSSADTAVAQNTHLHRSVTTESVAASVESRRRALVEGESITSLAQNTSTSAISPASGQSFRRGSLRNPQDFFPFIEVRLQCGESGLFLRICHKLKTICETKLAAAADSQRKRSQGRKTAAASISAFRQTVG